MKKLVLIVMMCFLIVPFMVDAKSCVATTGTGKKVGNEIKCGTESFYVINHSNDKTTMLAKYNLMVGDKIDYITAPSNAPVYQILVPPSNDAFNYCDSFARSNNYEPYYTFPMLDDSGKLLGCRVYEKIEYDHVVQDSRAVGTKLDGNGKSILPLYGITYMNPEWGYEAMHDGIIRDNIYDENGNLILENSSFKGYIDGYKRELQRQNISVSDVSFLTLDRTLKLLKDISGETVEVELEYASGYDEYDPEYYTGKMDIKGFAGKHKWIYDITYWLGSGFKWEDRPNTFSDYYISNEGMLCAIGRGECIYLPFPIGNGVRPIVTIENSYITFMKEDGTPEDDNSNSNPNNNGLIIVNPKTATIILMVLVIVFVTCVTSYITLRRNKNKKQ